MSNMHRDIDFKVRAIDEEKRTVDLSFSSEQPYQRWFGMEVLSHDSGAVDLTRLQEIGVLLFNHNRDYVLGKILSVSIDPVDKRGIATVQFDDDPQADLIYQKVKNETLKGVSVGYKVDVWEEVSSGSVSSNGRVQGPASIATKWIPFEISIVSVPADETVGVSRDLDDESEQKEIAQKDLQALRQRISNKILINI
jgi:HK97 family phage prohead protease